MRMLRSLDITGNKIRVLPLELGFCQDLRELHFDEQMIVMPTKEGDLISFLEKSQHLELP